MKNVNVRNMTIEDVKAIYDLSKACFSIPWSFEALTKELSNPLAEYQIAEIDGQIIGYGGLWCVMDEGEITNIAVDGDYRRQGIGEAILEALLQIAKQKRLTIVHLEARVSNVAAKGLYEKFGFHQIAIRKNYYQQPIEDAIIMQYKF
ncbi:ribosomal protein S18-alanine N-acetyltransferase [Cellulosilyticum sp. ST5]|uniref:ribosomal protein S18-alanine N-acetyltransferase n=1 Tax=Cellulosilyticum sp. ST5 TaxID=3055805 RepID=UPI003977419B